MIDQNERVSWPKEQPEKTEYYLSLITDRLKYRVPHRSEKDITFSVNTADNEFVATVWFEPPEPVN